MIREAEFGDFPWLAKRVEETVKKGWWGELPYTLTPNDVLKWLLDMFSRFGAAAFISEDNGEYNGHIIGNLMVTEYPPHLTVIKELNWAGDTDKIKVQLWRQLEQWGQERGAVLSVYSNLALDNTQVMKWSIL